MRATPKRCWRSTVRLADGATEDIPSRPVGYRTAPTRRSYSRSTGGCVISTVSLRIGTTPYWQLEWCVSDDHTAVRSTNPWWLDVTITLGVESLRATLDGDLNLIDTERTNT